MQPIKVTVLVYFLIHFSGSASIIDKNPAPNVKASAPYIVSIQFRKFYRWRHLCGGSIISSNYVLTAAHCFYHFFHYYRLKAFRVVAGTNDLNEISTASIHQIILHSMHPQYDHQFNGYDIGLLKVKPLFEFNGRTIVKIGFHSSEHVLGDVPVVFHGWGQTSRLRESNLTTLSNDDCISRGLVKLADIDVCVMGDDLTEGDSGGPLVNEEKNLQMGICSYTAFSQTHKRNYPSVFTRVENFVDWIEKEIERNSGQ